MHATAFQRATSGLTVNYQKAKMKPSTAHFDVLRKANAPTKWSENSIKSSSYEWQIQQLDAIHISYFLNSGIYVFL
jgi:hypothetical protein